MRSANGVDAGTRDPGLSEERIHVDHIEPLNQAKGTMALKSKGAVSGRP